MLPVVIFVVIAIPLLIAGFMVMRRSKSAGEHPSGETAADRARTEQEFAEAEQYEAKWRDQTHDELSEERFP